jgi:HSP20 family molecular chaperone IbpA
MPWDPLREVRAWQERLERLAAHHADSWTPPIDVYETADSYVVTAELPGLTREEVDLAVEDARLTIRGRRSDRGTAAPTSPTTTRSSGATAPSRAASTSPRRSTPSASRRRSPTAC